MDIFYSQKTSPKISNEKGHDLFLKEYHKGVNEVRRACLYFSSDSFLKEFNYKEAPKYFLNEVVVINQKDVKRCNGHINFMSDSKIEYGPKFVNCKAVLFFNPSCDLKILDNKNIYEIKKGNIININ